jgi:hypothetical protein
MKKDLSNSVKADIKEVIGIILHEVELWDVKAINDVIHVLVLSKKFGHPEDVPRIIERINEGEKHIILRLSSNETANERVENKSIEKLMRLKSAMEYYSGIEKEKEAEKEEAEKYLYFLIKDIKKLKEFREEINKELEGQNGKSSENEKIPKTKNINSIICVKPVSGDKFKIIVNNNYIKTLKGDQAKPSWNLLFEVANGKEIYDCLGYKNYLDYFNSNENNRLYTQTGYKITKILKRESGLIKPAIKIEMISEKAFQTRLKKIK